MLYLRTVKFSTLGNMRPERMLCFGTCVGNVYGDTASPNGHLKVLVNNTFHTVGF